MSLTEKLEKRVGWFVFGIIIFTLSTYYLFVGLSGLSIMRRDDFIARAEVADKYVKKEEVQAKWVLKQDLLGEYISKTDVQRDYILKSEIREAYLPKVVVLSEYVAWTAVQSDYITKTELQASYISKSRVQTDYLLKVDVETKYLPKSECQALAAKNESGSKNTPNVPAVSSDYGKTHSVDEQDFKFQLKECRLRTTTLTCEITIANESAERSVIFTKTHTPLSRFIDDTGREFYASDFELGAMTGTRVYSEIPKDVPVRASIAFRNVNSDVGYVRLLEIAFLVGKPGLVRGPFVVKIPDILIAK